MSSAAALTWFARHEFRLAWREWLAMMTGERRGRKRRAVIGLIAFAAIMHLPAYAVIGRFADLQAPLDKSTLIVITAMVFLAWALMLSQAIESVTRVFYARADLDLIMSSPVRLANVFSVRIAAIALSVTGMALLLSTPFVDVLVIGCGVRWFSAYGVVMAIGLSAAAVAVAVTIVLFRLIGPSRTRLAAQILAAIIGAGFVIALQIAAILSYSTLSRFAVLTSDAAAPRASRASSGGRRAPRSAMANHCCSCWQAASSCLAPRWRYSRRGLPTSSSALRRTLYRPVRAPARPRFVRAPGNRRCGGRNFCCCSAIRGWCRRP